MPAGPIRIRRLGAALRHEVELVVGTDQHVEAAGVSGIGVKDLARVVLDEHADAWEFFTDVAAVCLNCPEVVVDSTVGDLVMSEGNIEVIVEAAPEGRHPLETPTH